MLTDGTATQLRIAPSSRGSGVAQRGQGSGGRVRGGGYLVVVVYRLS